MRKTGSKKSKVSYGSGRVSGREDRNTIAVRTYVPLSVARRAGSELLTYRNPHQRIHRRRNRRLVLSRPRSRFVPVTFRLSVPSRLPAVRPSYVSLNRGRVNVMNSRAVRRLLRSEPNRRRYRERKTRRRHARNGQLESVRSDRFGIIANAYYSGASVERVADAALVSRALGG